MKAVDTNILVYAHREDSPFHQAALDAMLALTAGAETFAIPWPCVHEFLAIVTHPRIYKPPTPRDIAIASISRWLRSPRCNAIGEGPGYFERLSELLTASKVMGPQVHDARVAAICLDHGVSALLTCDRDFSRFAALKTENPL